MAAIFKKIKEIFSFRPTIEQAKDTGMALVLLCLLISYFGDHPSFLMAAVVILLINMAYPALYRPVARWWLGASQILGTIISTIILSLIFFLIVTPIGVIRRMLGADPLQLKKWKQGDASVFIVRDHTFGPDDIINPY